MSWLFSRALVEAFSEATCSDGEQSAQLNVMPTPHKFWHNGKTMEPSRLSQFGLTLNLLTAERGEELLTWYQAVSHARTYHWPAQVPASMATDLAHGGTWRALWAKFDRASCSWRTHQHLWEEALPESSVIFQRWGMTRDGVLWGPGMSVLPTYASARGSLHLIPTPTVYGNYNRKGLSKMFPTPTATDGNKWNNKTVAERKAQGRTVRLNNTLQAGGKLNPLWVEWLMGWPIGWTSLEPLETGKFRQWLSMHGSY